MNNLEKLITDLSNYWDISPDKVVDRLNFMNEQEINKIVDKMTKKFQSGGYLSRPPIGNRMIISKATTYKPRTVISDEQIDSAMRAENKAKAEQFKREAAGLQNRLFQTQTELVKRRATPVMKTQPTAPVTNSDPQYFNGSRNVKFANGGVMKCLKGGKTYSECMKCGGKPIVKNQEPAGPIKIEPEIEPSGFFRRMFWKPTEHPRVDSYDKFDGDFTGTRSSYYTHDGDLMQILTKRFPAGNTAKTELLIKNPHTPMADSTMTIINGNGIDKIRNMRKAKQFLPAFKKNF